MRGKLLFAAGLAAGYVIGARAGRPAYDAITERVAALRDDPTVRSVGARAERTLEEKAPKVAAAAEGAARTARAAAEGATSASGGAGDDDDDGASGTTGSTTSGTDAGTAGRSADTDGPTTAR